MWYRLLASLLLVLVLVAVYLALMPMSEMGQTPAPVTSPSSGPNDLRGFRIP